MSKLQLVLGVTGVVIGTVTAIGLLIYNKKKKPKYNFSNYMYDFDHSEAPYLFFKEC